MQKGTCITIEGWGQWKIIFCRAPPRKGVINCGVRWEALTICMLPRPLVSKHVVYVTGLRIAQSIAGLVEYFGDSHIRNVGYQWTSVETFSTTLGQHWQFYSQCHGRRQGLKRVAESFWILGAGSRNPCAPSLRSTRVRFYVGSIHRRNQQQ